MVMLLATSGAMLAMGEGGGEAGAEVKLSAYKRSKKTARRGWHAMVRFGTWPARKLARTPKTPPCCATSEELVATQKEKELLDAIYEWKRFGNRVHLCVTIGLAAALIQTARNQKVQDGVKRLIRGVRSLRRKKAPEKRTDGTRIEEKTA